jgi:hypothetical protein
MPENQKIKRNLPVKIPEKEAKAGKMPKNYPYIKH